MNTKPNEELREQIYAKLKSDKRADTYVIPTRVMDVVVDFIQTEIAETERRAIKECTRRLCKAFDLDEEQLTEIEVSKEET